MKSYPSSEGVRAGLGDKMLTALGVAVALSREDLRGYRKLRPLWLAQASERGLAAWIHDRLWYHLSVLLEGAEDVALIDHEPTRAIGVGHRYRLRVKRHHDDGKISTYPTQTALEFLMQGLLQEPLEGLEEIHLIAGYHWMRIPARSVRR